AGDRRDAASDADALDVGTQETPNVFPEAALSSDASSEAVLSWDPGDAMGPGPDSAIAACGPDSVANITLGTASAGSAFDPLGYAPYAIDECTLAYLRVTGTGQSSGELRLRLLASGSETLLAAASDQPGRPSIAGSLVAWEAVVAAKRVVRVSHAGQITTLAGPFDHAGEPHCTSDAVVFTAWLSPDDTGDTDVYVYLPVSGQVVAIATGPGQQRFADISSSFVAVTDFSEDPTGAFSPTTHRNADVVVYDRKTLTRTVRHLPGKQAFPMLGATSSIGYLDWGAVNPEPKFSAYTIRAGAISSDPTTDRNVKGAGQVTVYTPYVRPSVLGDWIEWVDESSGGGLFRAPIDRPLSPTSTLQGYRLLGPMAGRPLSVVASIGTSASILHGVAW
ncbi:MAG: hypothetical protein M3O46_21775, partial [Myxococcota bacterium]|nr:hypothetical protein [Myxococcota bacterium]